MTHRSVGSVAIFKHSHDNDIIHRGNGTGDYNLVCALLRAQLAWESGLSIQQTVMCHHMIGTSSYNIVDSL